MRNEYGTPGVYRATITLDLSMFMSDPDDVDGIMEEALLLMKRGEIVPEVECEFQDDATREHVADTRADWLMAV